jgi:hypothetical protein
MPGFVDFVTAADIPGTNLIGTPTHKVFWSVGERMPFVGAIIGVALADSSKRARAIAKAITLSYDTTDKAEQRRRAWADAEALNAQVSWFFAETCSFDSQPITASSARRRRWQRPFSNCNKLGCRGRAAFKSETSPFASPLC